LGGFVTIAISVQVHDGVVLASDSASTLTDARPGPDNIVNVYNNANKIFNLRKGLPIGGMTYGAGSIGASSISTLVKDIRQLFTDDTSSQWKIDEANYTVEGVAKKTQEFLIDCWSKAIPGLTKGSLMGFTVAGYSAGAPLSEVWNFEIKDGVSQPPQLVTAQGVPGVHAAGDPEVFSRLVLGHGLKLGDALVKGGVDPSAIGAVIDALRAEMHVQLFEAPMPIQDAIDFAEFLVDATAQFTRFKRGAATVGGPTESAVITKHEGFKWTRRKHYFNTILNPGG
jgi:hypothetical protein